MKRFMAVGQISAGKTTLCRVLAGLPAQDKKTQTAEVMGQAIDTPGEYLEHRSFYRALSVLSVEAERILLLQSCVAGRLAFPPGISALFGPPLIGVVTKIDLAENESQIAQARRHLEQAGAREVYCVSSLTLEGIDELRQALA